jgi:GT2 family glycosyltransferase
MYVLQVDAVSKDLTPPLVSIIILNYNGAAVVDNCMQSVLNTDYPNFEVIFVDNASVDGSYQSVVRQFGGDNRVLMVRNNVNEGFAGGNNVGLRYAKGDYITLLNNDTEVEKEWISEAIRIAESDAKIGVIQSKLFFWYNPEILESAGAFIDKAGYGFEKGFVRGKDVFNSSEEVFYGNGAAVTIKRAAIERIQDPGKFELFDSDFFFAYEDVDLSWRLRLGGFKTVVAPCSIVYHRRSTSTSRRRGLLVFHHCKNRVLTLLKNYSFSNLCKYLPILFVLESVRALSSLGSGNLQSARAIFRAFLWNLANFKRTWKKRLVVQYLVRRMSDDYVTMLMNDVNPARLIYNQRLYQKFSDATGVNIVR